MNIRSTTTLAARFIREEQAASSTEYAVLLGTCIVISIAAIAAFGTNFGGMVGSAGAALEQATPFDVSGPGSNPLSGLGGGATHTAGR